MISKKVTIFAVLLLTAAAMPARGEDPQEIFDQARELYDNRDFAAAAQHYQTLIERGYNSHEVFFNLGNAWYRAGDLGRAVLNWRRARRLAPRDPDIRANLQFALEKAGTTAPEPRPHEKLAFLLPMWGWCGLVAGGLWLLALTLLAHRLMPAARNAAGRLLALWLLAIVLAATGGAVRQRALQRPEAVITAAETRALYGPVEGATPHFPLPEGAIVLILEQRGKWLEIEHNGRRGFIMDSDCRRV